MGEMKTLKFPGDSEPREIVDAKAREELAKKIPVPDTAAVGQTIAVKAVDEDGKPTEWEAADMASGGGAGVSNYSELDDKPSINGVELSGNKTSADLGIGTPTDEQVASATEAWLDAHPEATTTVADGSITKEKLAFTAYEGVLSPNLINPNELISARFNSANGNRQTFSEGSSYYDTWRMTGYIDVSSHVGEQIWIHNMQGYFFYDSNKTAIADSGYFNSVINGGIGETVGVTVPDGASYVVLSMFHASGRVYMANYGDELLVYSPFGGVALPANSVRAENIDGQLPLDKINTENLLLPTVGVNLIDKSRMVKNYKMSTDGTPTAVAEALQNWYVTDIPVIGGDTYLVYGADVVFFDVYGNVCGADTINNNLVGVYRAIIAPAFAVCCSVNSSGYYDIPADMEHGAFLIHGNKLPDRVVNAKYYEANALEDKTLYKSVLSRMADCWNPTTKTTIGLYGDSNTAGIEGKGNTTQNPECWANLLTAEIQRKLTGERYIYPFGYIGVWGCDVYNYREAKIVTGIVKVPFYGTSITMVSSTISTVPKQFNVSFDDGEPVLYTIEETGTYTWDGLDEGYHTITMISADNVNFTIQKFIVNKTVEVINRGISGRNLGCITTDVGTVSDTIEIICSGTNNRENKDVLSSEQELFLWEYWNRATKHIYISPIPALDAIEEASEAWATVPYIESFIAGREARKNCEYISLYYELKDYCIKNGVELSNLYADDLHLNDAGHKVVAQILCRKFGLGDLTETTE